jgi:site-specific recombinase XerC
VDRFASIVGDPAGAGPSAVHAFAYGPGLSGRLPSPSTVAVRLAALVSFYDFATRMRAYTHNPAGRGDVRRPRARLATPRGLDADELRRLLAAIPGHAGGLRDRAIILTAVLTGLRRAELFALTAGSLSSNGRVYYETRHNSGTAARRSRTPASAGAEVDRQRAADPAYEPGNLWA